MTALNTTDIATELDTTPRNLRKFLRADAADRDIATPGKGSRYSIERRELRSLRTRFAKWDAARIAAMTPDADAPADA